MLSQPRFTPKPFGIEEAWSGGPLRKVGTGKGAPTKYVCDACESVVGGVYPCRAEDTHLKRRAGRQQPWFCAGCRSPRKVKVAA